MNKCTQCGKCCIKYEGELGSITKAEYDRLPSFAKEYASKLPYLDIYDIWVSPTENDKSRCPWLYIKEGKYYCEIYENRPDVCRNYPYVIEQAIWDECEMADS